MKKSDGNFLIVKTVDKQLKTETLEYPFIHLYIHFLIAGKLACAKILGLSICLVYQLCLKDNDDKCVNKHRNMSCLVLYLERFCPKNVNIEISCLLHIRYSWNIPL